MARIWTTLRPSTTVPPWSDVSICLWFAWWLDMGIPFRSLHRPSLEGCYSSWWAHRRGCSKLLDGLTIPKIPLKMVYIHENKAKYWMFTIFHFWLLLLCALFLPFRSTFWSWIPAYKISRTDHTMHKLGVGNQIFPNLCMCIYILLDLDMGIHSQVWTLHIFNSSDFSCNYFLLYSENSNSFFFNSISCFKFPIFSDRAFVYP